MKEQKILVTGARQGIGRDSAFALADRGHEVFATTETDEQAGELARKAETNGRQMRVERLDLRDQADHQKAVDFAPDVLINNAAIGESGPLAELPMERLRDNFDTNVFHAIELTQDVLEGMLERGSGRIIILSSVGGKLVLPYFGAYHMTKFALEAAGDAFRGELTHHGISVSVIEPGAINTGFNERMNATKYQWFDEHARLGADMDRVAKYEAALTRTQHPTDSVTRAVIHAVESTKPKTRYVRPLWPYAPMLWLATAIPGRLRDWVLGKMAGV
ncbi:short-chain dehydrogenase [Candidatus Saccharibacteria bacterium QS_5_54_17]|nr:MAG: short-chain dehydrogenase [Candidatus Saccharibacteria bacterium QS_5_54_17]